MPSIIKKFFYLRCNIIIKGRDAASLFNDEIVYNILVACEYYNSMQAFIDNDLKCKIKNFYVLEIKYYITKLLSKISHSNCTHKNNVYLAKNYTLLS